MPRQMKDSGIPWVGLIPHCWDIGKGKNILTLLSRQVKDDDGVITCFRDGEVTLRANRRTEGYTFSDKEIGYQGIEPGDLVVHGMDGFAGAIGISDSRGKATPVLNVLDSTQNKVYLMYYLRMMATTGVFLSLSTGIRVRSCDTNWNKIKELLFPMPSVDEQNRIALYLDEQCNRILNIINQTRITIEEYKKMKQAVITRAVTKGIRNDRKMKDCGYDFIGEIPVEWDILKVRNIGTPQNGISKGAEFFGEGYPFVSYGDVYRNMALPKTVTGLVRSTDEEQEKYSVHAGDIFFTRTSETIEEVGFSSVCEKDIANATFAGFLIRVRPTTSILSIGFSKYYFRSSHHRSYLAKEMNLVTRASLGQTLLKGMPVLVPPIEEQEDIAQYLDKKCFEIDEIIEKKQRLIENMEQYKKSLIYEYVTGKKEVPQS